MNCKVMHESVCVLARSMCVNGEKVKKTVRWKIGKMERQNPGQQRDFSAFR